MIKQFAYVVTITGLWAGCGVDSSSGPSVIDLQPGELASAPTTTPPPAPGGTWSRATTAPFTVGIALLLPDGTLMVQQQSSPNWWRYSPDVMGSYKNGTWKQLGSMPNGYAPLYFGSAVLPDGRLVVEGGEYQAGAQAWTTLGAVYDPKMNKWTKVDPPTGWTTIGDASAIMGPDNKLLLSDCCSTKLAVLDPVAMTWTNVGTGKMDHNDEEGWTLLPDNTIYTVDCHTDNQVNPLSTEYYNFATQKWTAGPNTPAVLTNSAEGFEMGPQVLRYDNTMVAVGSTGHNALYHLDTKTWTALPDSPTVGGKLLGAVDAPGVLLPNGNVLVALAPAQPTFSSGTTYYEFDGAAFNSVAAPPNAPNDATYTQNFLLLPTGEILLTDFTTDIEMYTPAPGVVEKARPVVVSVPKLADGSGPIAPEPPLAGEELAALPLTTVSPGHTYKVTALRMNGLSEATVYGDDNQAPTNFPLIRLTNMTTNHVFYANTHDHTTRAIGVDVRAATKFDIPATAERGLAKLELVANGIPSPAITVNIK